ncbi:MAG TPA: ABC transporter ATP-binding protein [Gaiellaceae bacterium]|nr:ABC transporter ATP-binding protein [Gaiellaceae bacterium]
MSVHEHSASAGARAGGEPPLVELIGIRKAYPGVLANDDVSFSVRRGEVHCLLGENGAGKSTLIGILSGLVRPDAGAILIDGREVSIDSPRTALEHGIGTVYQHSTLIPALSVLENLMLGDTRRLRLDVAGARRRLAEFGEMLGVEVDPDATAADLSLGRQQQVEIVKALWRGSRVLVLDEPTSMLTPQAFAELEQVLGRLKGQGLGVVFITHKLHEALSLGDRITVLRQGRIAGTLEGKTLRAAPAEELRAAIVGLMFGEEAPVVTDVAELREDIERVELDHDRRRAAEAETVLELDDVSAPGHGTEPGVEHVSLRLGFGEILGVAGIDGNGQRALAEVVAGQRHATHGHIRLYDAPVTHLSVSARQKLGLRYVTDDRLGEGTLGGLSVSLNLFLKRIGQRPFWRFGRMQRGPIEQTAGELVQRFDVRTPSVSTRAGTLSGGNIQKVMLARELSFDPKVVVFHKPTYGLDVKTTATVRDMIRGLARAGGAALVISTDLDELLEICDRIAVLSRGRLVGIVANEPGAAEQVGRLMVGDAAVEAAA